MPTFKNEPEKEQRESAEPIKGDAFADPVTQATTKDYYDKHLLDNVFGPDMPGAPSFDPPKLPEKNGPAVKFYKLDPATQRIMQSEALERLEKNSRGVIFVGYQGVGKSTVARTFGRYVDLESGSFWINGKRDEKWYEVYCSIAEHLCRQGKRVFVSSHAVVRERLRRSDCDVVMIYPAPELKTNWIMRLEERYIFTQADKDYKAWKNALEKYDENIADLSAEPLFGHIIITEMKYDLVTLIEQPVLDPLWPARYRTPKKASLPAEPQEGPIKTLLAEVARDIKDSEPERGKSGAQAIQELLIDEFETPAGTMRKWAPIKKPPAEKMTIPQWCDFLGVKIIDPDGFDRTDPQLYERLFSYAEFEFGFMQSTVKVIEKKEGEN